MSGRCIIADASRVTGAEFFSAITGKPPRTDAEKARDGELAQASLDHRQAMAKAPRGRSAYWERKRYDDECRAAYVARIREINERYAEQLTETQSDPFGDPMRRVM